MSDFPEPHEGISGINQTANPLLYLDDPHIAVRLAVIQIVKHLYRAVLSTNIKEPVPPDLAKLYEEMTHPSVGDYVFELSTMYNRAKIDLVHSFGILLGDRDEWAETNKEWQAESAEEGLEDSERVIDHGWYVQYGPQPIDVCRWTNCDFIAVPFKALGFIGEW